MLLALPVSMMDDFYDDQVMATRRPSPGLAAVLSVVIPGLGQVYSGRLVAGGLWFLAASFGYWAVLVPGLLIHGLSVWFAYRDARRWRGW